MEVNTAPLELYIHIPFCTSKCAYCDFVSFPVHQGAGGTGTMAEYTDALVSEIKARGGVYGNRPISSVYIGGGTPSVLPEHLSEKIITALFDSFQIKRKVSRANPARLASSFRYALGMKPKITKIREDYEFSVEINPGTVTPDKLKMYRNLGVNRLSIGLQSPDDRDLLVLGRRHTFAQFRETFELARKAGFENINIDLMQSIPGQTQDRFERGLLDILEFRPEHISIYSLTLEKGTPFYNSRITDKKGNTYVKSPGGAMVKLPGEDEDRAIYHMTKVLTKAAGYRRYEISNYAVPGRECEHNIGYWRRQDYLGLGLNSSSMIDNVRWKNITDIRKYIEGCAYFAAGEDAIRQNVYKVAAEDQMAEFMFLGLRMMDGISKREFAKTFAVDYDTVYGNQTEYLAEAGLIKVWPAEYDRTGQILQDSRVALTERGIDVSNVALAYFLPE